MTPGPFVAKFRGSSNLYLAGVRAVTVHVQCSVLHVSFSVCLPVLLVAIISFFQSYLHYVPVSLRLVRFVAEAGPRYLMSAS